MLDVFNFPTPQQSNYQEFYGGGTTRDWVKPRGASMVRFMLIGAGGGGGDGSTTVGNGGGGSGSITSWIGPAIFVPDVLRVIVGLGGYNEATGNGTTSAVRYQAKDSNGYILLSADGGIGSSGTTTGGAGGAAMTATAFTASGIFSSTAGQAGAAGSSTGAGINQTASTTTFLSGGAGGAGAAASTGGSVTPNYGYTVLPATTAGGTVAGANGYFITQPILLGVGGAGGTTNTTVGTAGGKGGIGCGGGGGGEDGVRSRGGDGAVFIWAW
jgi:hypothetical protein